MRILTAPALLLSAIGAAAQGTAFTYQGQLQNNGSPASGTYNLQFLLYTNSTGGMPVAGPVETDGVLVSNGLFTVLMDFGAGPWNGRTNWLEIGVETNGATPFTTLAPRQDLTPVPYAIFANMASNLSGTLPAAQLAGTIANGNLPASPTFSGTVTANGFSGNGSALTGLTPANVSAGTANINISGNAATATTAGNYGGTIALSQLTPAGAVVTNNEPSVTLSNLTLNGSLSLPAVSQCGIGSGCFC